MEYGWWDRYGDRPDAASAFTCAAAAVANETPADDGGRSPRPAERRERAPLRDRHAAEAAGDRERRDLRVARGRDRDGAGHRMAEHRRDTASGAAELKIDGGEGYLAERRDLRSLVAERLRHLTSLLGRLSTVSRDFY